MDTTPILDSITFGNVVMVVGYIISIVVVITLHGASIKTHEVSIKTLKSDFGKQQIECRMNTDTTVTKELLNAKLENIDTQIGHIESGQRRVEEKIDELIRWHTDIKRKTE